MEEIIFVIDGKRVSYNVETSTWKLSRGKKEYKQHVDLDSIRETVANILNNVLLVKD